MSPAVAAIRSSGSRPSRTTASESRARNSSTAEAATSSMPIRRRRVWSSSVVGKATNSVVPSPLEVARTRYLRLPSTDRTVE
jgi:hypothetical protein